MIGVIEMLQQNNYQFYSYVVSTAHDKNGVAISTGELISHDLESLRNLGQRHASGIPINTDLCPGNSIVSPLPRPCFRTQEMYDVYRASYDATRQVPEYNINPDGSKTPNFAWYGNTYGWMEFLWMVSGYPDALQMAHQLKRNIL